MQSYSCQREESRLFPLATVYVLWEYSLKAHMDRFRPESFLPLTPVAFEILLALADGERHGYSILQEVERRSGGTVSLHAGTLYRALARLLESELIEELTEAPDPKNDDDRRRYYRLTTRASPWRNRKSPGWRAAIGRSLAAIAERCPDVMRRLFSLALFAILGPSPAIRRRNVTRFRRRPRYAAGTVRTLGRLQDQRPR
jgi:DNA-binding PadR family transcriptional regulator